MQRWDGRFLKKRGQLCSDAPMARWASVPLSGAADTAADARDDKKGARHAHTDTQAHTDTHATYWKAYRTPNRAALNVLWVLRLLEVQVHAALNAYLLVAMLAGVLWVLWVLWGEGARRGGETV